MLDAKEAAGKALKYFQELYPHLGGPILLEEIERTEDGKFWLVTLSYAAVPGDVFVLSRREYKVFKVNDDSGEVVSMKIRTIK